MRGDWMNEGVKASINVLNGLQGVALLQTPVYGYLPAEASLLHVFAPRANIQFAGSVVFWLD